MKQQHLINSLLALLLMFAPSFVVGQERSDHQNQFDFSKLEEAANPQGDATARARIVGSWRVVSYELEFQDGEERRFPLGAHPNGYLVFGSDGRMMAYLEANERKAPQTDAERADAFRSMMAYTGKYRVQGDKWITKVDGAWNVAWVGTDQERSFTLEDDRLKVVTPWTRNAFFSGRVIRGHLTFEREK